MCKAGPHDDKLSQVIFLDSNSAICFLPPQTRFISYISFWNILRCLLAYASVLLTLLATLLISFIQVTNVSISFNSIIYWFLCAPICLIVWLQRSWNNKKKQNKTNVKYQNFGYEKNYKWIIKSNWVYHVYKEKWMNELGPF